MVEQQNEPSKHPVLLQAIGLERRAGADKLLDGVCVTILDGDRVAIVGPTGCGKTLLLRSLALLDSVDSGEITWYGKTVTGHEIPTFRSQVIYLHQTPALIDGTVEANLRLPFSLRVHQDKSFDRARIIEILQSLGRAESFLLKGHRELSGGERQIVALLRAIQLEPLVLLLDEPTAALDADSARAVESLVQRWYDDGLGNRATVWVSHDLEQSARMADRMIFLAKGKIVREQ